MNEIEAKHIEILEALSLNGQRQYDYILKLIQDTRKEGVEMARKEILDLLNSIDELYDKDIDNRIARKWGFISREEFMENKLKQSLEDKKP
jgi:hypothetical protein